MSAGLSPEVARLLELERTAAGPDALVRARVRGRLAASIGGPPAGDGGGGASEAGSGSGEAASAGQLPSAAAATGAGLSAKVMAVVSSTGFVAATTFAVGLAVGAVGSQMLADRPVASQQAVSAPATTSPEPAALEPPELAALATVESPEPEPVDEAPPVDVVAPEQGRADRERRRPEATGERRRKSADQSLARERDLLERARVALVRGDTNEALVQLQRHRREFSGGRLDAERDALEVQALVASGQAARARRAAEAFRARHPGSLFAPVVDKALEGLP